MGRRNCSFGRCSFGGGHRRTPVLRDIGIVLMVVGGLILLVSIPMKFWLALFGLALLFFGFVLWRIA